jgi:hypothetical protein
VSLKQWARKSLQRGDLTALSRISEHESDDRKPSQIDRLEQRGFLVKKAGGSFGVTFKGRTALWINKPRARVGARARGRVGPILVCIGLLIALFYWMIV